MKYKILVFIFCVLIRKSYPLKVGECEIDDSSNDNDLTNSTATGVLSITIDDVGDLNNVYSTTGDLNLKVENDAAQTAADYVDITWADDTFKIMTNDKFKNNFEADKMNEPASDAMTIAVTFSLCCGVDCADAGAAQTFSTTLRLTVTDTNNHAPAFTAKTYTYKLPSPLTPGVDLTSAGTEISVTDLDFSNTDVTFTVEPADNFIVETVNRNGREYKGVLKVNKYTNLLKTTSLTITATDSGNPVQSANATVEINVDSENSLSDKPSLSKGLYRFDYNAKDSSLTPAEGQEIKITTTSSGEVTVQIRDDSGAESPYFKAEYDSSTGLVTVESTDNKPESSSDPVLVLQLVAFFTGNEEDSSNSVILIQLPSELVATGPKFSAAYYQTTYKILDDGPSLDSVTITVTDKNAVVTLDDASENFKVDANSDGGYTVSVETPLDVKTLLTGSDIVLKLQAETQGIDEVATATLVISLPRETTPFKFSTSVYEANYKKNADPDLDTVTTTEDIKISSTYSTDDLEVTLTSPAGYEENFAVTTTTPYQINVLKDLTDEVLLEGKDIVLTLVATFDKEEVATATVKVALPTVPASPKFSKPTYTAKYNTDNTVELLDGTISTDPNDPQTVTIKVDDTYSKIFALNYDDTAKGYQVSVDQSNPLDFDNISEPVIYVLITATVVDAKSSASATLAIQLPDKTENIVPKFSKTSYTAQYTSDNKVTDITPLIIIDSDNAADTTVQVIGDYQSNFEAKYDGTSWVLDVKNNLEDKQSTIGISLKATLSGSAGEGYATVILRMPDGLKAAPAFGDRIYNANYNVIDADTAEVSDPSITIKSDGQAEVTLGSYESNFELTNDDGTEKWTLKVKEPLSKDILNSQTKLAISLKATLDNSQADGYATLIIQLPEQEEISFDNSYYQTTYKENTGTDVDEFTKNVELTINDGAEISISPDDYKDNFGVSCDAGKCTLKVVKDLDPKVLEENTELLLVLEASKTDVIGRATAVVLITLPLQEKAKSPEFTETVYTFTYGNDGVLTPEDGNIELLSDATDVEVNFNGGNIGDSSVTDYFTITKTDTQWEVNVIKPLPNDILKSEPALSFTLVATKTGITPTGQAALIVKLPKQQASGTSFYFDETVYLADYETDETSSNVKIDGGIKIEGDDIADVEVIVKAGDYQEYFTSSMDSNGEVTVSTADILKNDTLNENVAISITLVASKGSESTEATVVIRLPKKFSPTILYFENGAYVADYKVDNNKPSFTQETDIVIKNDVDGTATITLSGDNIEYFNHEYSDGKVIVSLKDETSPLPNDVISGQSFISFDIVAVKESETTTTKLVIKLPAAEAGNTFDFTDTVYLGDYEAVGSSSKLETEEIKLEGDITDVTVDIEDGDYKEYFTSTIDLKTGIVTVTSKGVLASDTLDKEVAITINLVASKKSENVKTAIVVKLPKKLSPTSIYFDNGAYVADYKVDNNKPTLTQESDIVIKNDVDGTATITLSGDNTDYFDYKYNDGKVSVSLKDETSPLPNDVISGQSFISFDIVAVKGSETTTTKLVIRLPAGQAESSFYFDNTVYLASYQFDDASSSLTIDEIKLEGDIADVTLDIEETDYKTYFTPEIDSSNGKVSITTEGVLGSDILDEETAITITLVASKNSENVKTALVIKLPKTFSPTMIYFESGAYVADYKVENDKPTLTQESIIIIRNDPDGNAAISFSGDDTTTALFKYDYADSKVTVSLKDEASGLPDDVISGQSFISFDIVAEKESEKTSTKLVIKLPKAQSDNDGDGENTTGLIAAVSVLAVLLVASLVGSAVFYYLKFRRGGTVDGLAY